ncbi:ABC transporter ATP-binding protein [Arvimicrobium flavum]|uniref:ABC transporter ATP-binding protein n=1 Tax=Arvimicrobium flavum TaxID=3393320 RepID=UPI00237BFCF9|nr:sn-glycerol-3-phosphate ABC transporter ATP-binding protein UgpC [Mesorhizobium shangrilense]
MARIQFKGITKNYAGGVIAVDTLDLEIRDREFLVLLGPSGCGKSTTLNMIAGLEDPTSGELWFDDLDVTFLPPHKRDVAMVFQSYALYPHKNVYENIAFGLRMRKVANDEIERRVRDAARKLEIEHLLERRPGQLSGGQRQRVALGRAMVREPSVFLMDEPLSNLDAALRISMRAEIKHLHAAMGTTFVYVTHDQAEALTLADRIVVMQHGVVQQIGTPDEIYEKPANMFVASFLGSPPINYLRGTLQQQGDAVSFVNGEVRLDLDAATTARIKGRPDEVVIGIRPEDVEPNGASGPVLDGLVDSVLPVGSDRFLGLKLNETDLFIRVGKEARQQEGDRISFALVPERIHVFDGASGKNIAAAS